MLLHFSNKLTEAGCDEAGRGCLAGPVYAAAVILPKDFSHPKLRDSKTLSAKAREELRDIIEKEAVSFSVKAVDVETIDRINILKASILGMHQAVEALRLKPEVLLIDGNRFIPYDGIPHQCIVKGDNKYLCIAAASILAKTYRDEYMRQLGDQFPHYGWAQNKGYGTLAHRIALESNGPCKYHRRSFSLQAKLLFPS